MEKFYNDKKEKRGRIYKDRTEKIYYDEKEKFFNDKTTKNYNSEIMNNLGIHEISLLPLFNLVENSGVEK